LEDFRNGLDSNPVQLNILANRDVGDAVAVPFRKVGKNAKLFGGEEPAGYADADHEERECAPFSAGAANHTQAVTLGIDAPRAEIRGQPFRGDGRVTEASEFADFVEVLPRILGAFKTLDALSLGFFGFGHVILLKHSA